MASSATCKGQRSHDASIADWFSCDGNERIHMINAQGKENPFLTRGAFGEISIAIDTSTNQRGNGWQLAVVKDIPRATISLGSSFGSWGSAPSESTKNPKLVCEVFNELVALRMLGSHPCIVSLIGICTAPSRSSTPGGISLAFPYHPLEMQMILDRQRRLALPSLSFGIVKTIAKDIMLAVEYCHRKGVLHRDVKPGNLLLTLQGRVQLCDFGLATPCLENVSLPTRDSSTGSKGLCTLYYRPPEVLLGCSAGHPSVDIFSSGLVVAELILGIPIFCGKNVFDQLARIFNVLGTPSDEHWPNADTTPDYGKVSYPARMPQAWATIIPRAAECPFLIDWLSNLVTLDPLKRQSATKVLQHVWFTSQPQLLSSQKLAEELIPKELHVPKVFFSSRDTNIKTMKNVTKYAFVEAARRRAHENVDRSTLKEDGQEVPSFCNLLKVRKLDSLTSLHTGSDKIGTAEDYTI